MENVEVIHQGRGGFVVYEGYIYTIDHVQAGHFCIQFPSGNKHKKLGKHLGVLRAFALRQDPKWYVGNNQNKPHTSKDI